MAIMMCALAITMSDLVVILCDVVIIITVMIVIINDMVIIVYDLAIIELEVIRLQLFDLYNSECAISDEPSVYPLLVIHGENGFIPVSVIEKYAHFPKIINFSFRYSLHSYRNHFAGTAIQVRKNELFLQDW